MANIYHCSNGERVEQSVIDQRTRKAKAKKLQKFLNQHGYYFCEDCERSDSKPIDCSHEISVQEAKNTGKTELCWDVDNIKLRCRKCHQKLDKLDVQFNPNR